MLINKYLERLLELREDVKRKANQMSRTVGKLQTNTQIVDCRVFFLCLSAVDDKILRLLLKNNKEIDRSVVCDIYKCKLDQIWLNNKYNALKLQHKYYIQCREILANLDYITPESPSELDIKIDNLEQEWFTLTGSRNSLDTLMHQISLHYVEGYAFFSDPRHQFDFKKIPPNISKERIKLSIQLYHFYLYDVQNHILVPIFLKKYIQCLKKCLFGNIEYDEMAFDFISIMNYNIQKILKNIFFDVSFTCKETNFEMALSKCKTSEIYNQDAKYLFLCKYICI